MNRYINDHHYIVTGVASSRIRDATSDGVRQRPIRATRGQRKGCRSYLPHGSDLFHVAVPKALPLSTLPSSVPPRAAFNGSATLADQKPVKEVGGMPALPARR